MVPSSDGSEAFVTFGRGILKVFNNAKNFGFVSPVFKNEDGEGPPLPACAEEGLWFFGNHQLPNRASPGVELTFEIWENNQGKAQARNVKVSTEPSHNQRDYDDRAEFGGNRQSDRSSYGGGYGNNDRQGGDRYGSYGGGGDRSMQNYGRGGRNDRNDNQRRHQNEPKVIYPSVYVSDVPVEYTETTLRELHRQLGLNPDAIMGLKFLPFTEVSLGTSGGEKSTVTPVTGAVILRYLNEEAANAAVERLRGHPIRTSKGVTKYLGAKHAAPAKWVIQRQQEEDETKTAYRPPRGSAEAIMQKVRGNVVRVSAAGYGVIKSAEWGEVMWRQYELPTNLRTMQFADKRRFDMEITTFPDYQRLKEMEGRDVEAELYKTEDGQMRASHVRLVSSNGATAAKLEDQGHNTSSSSYDKLFLPGSDQDPGFEEDRESPPRPAPPASEDRPFYPGITTGAPPPRPGSAPGPPPPPPPMDGKGYGKGPGDPYFKTQPCPYFRQGQCQAGHECFYAHSMEELRPPPEAQMMQMMQMLHSQKKKEKKKDKKEKKRKREFSDEEDGDDDDGIKEEYHGGGRGGASYAKDEYAGGGAYAGVKYEDNYRRSPSFSPRGPPSRKRRVEERGY